MTNLDNSTAVRDISSYLRLLYSRSFFLSTQNDYKYKINENDLLLEQKARQSNLFVFLNTSKLPIFDLLPEDQLRKDLSKFCDSESFWVFSGRTLLENFCLYIYNLEPYRNLPDIREIIMISGVISGLSQGENKSHSPWKNHQVKLIDEGNERFWQEETLTNFKFINQEGKLDWEKYGKISNSKPSRFLMSISFATDGVKLNYEEA